MARENPSLVRDMKRELAEKYGTKELTRLTTMYVNAYAFDGRHGEKVSGGWNYRTAFF